jgi:GNAT superfamily N-acetyltransferase
VEFELRDGSICRIRPIDKGDRQRLQAAFDRLSANSRRLRFFGVKKALTQAELDYLAAPDGRDHIAYGAVRLDQRGIELEGLGAARCIRLAPDSDTAELAIAVVDEAQGEGIGGNLLRQLVQAARRQGIRRFRCEVLAENNAMRALAVSMGSDARRVDDSVLEYECPLPAPGQEDDPLGLAMLFSAIDDGLAFSLDLADKTAASVAEVFDSWTPREIRAALGGHRRRRPRADPMPNPAPDPVPDRAGHPSKRPQGFPEGLP